MWILSYKYAVLYPITGSVRHSIVMWCCHLNSMLSELAFVRIRNRINKYKIARLIRIGRPLGSTGVIVWLDVL